MEKEPEQEALFQLEGPDEDGCVWACSPGGRDVWCQNLGPAAKVVDVMSRWIESVAYDEREQSMPIKPDLSLRELNDRLAKRSRKQARPDDHREEGGQG